ncbi:MAG: dihydrofolate reductase, partial [Bacteroidales bacterium]|nr:dihydrofolate reductase [Bacteroidales bacterium]
NNVIELRKENDKTYVIINDYQKLRTLFGELLAEVQRIKSEGDFDAGKQLVESYGIKIDTAMHNEVLERFKKLDIPAYSGFVNPYFELTEENGEIKDIKLQYTNDYVGQMLKYSKEYSLLPVYNF